MLGYFDFGFNAIYLSAWFAHSRKTCEPYPRPVHPLIGANQALKLMKTKRWAVMKGCDCPVIGKPCNRFVEDGVEDGICGNCGHERVCHGLKKLPEH